VTYDPANKTQRSYQWNLSVGQELWRGAAAEAQYIGSHDLDLDTSWYSNMPPQMVAGVVFSQPKSVALNSAPGSCGQANCLVRPNQLFGSIRDLRNFAWAEYNGLSLILRQRLIHGLSGQGSYTWSHDLDISTDSNGGGVPSQQYNLAADYGNSNWDIRHRFVGVLTYELPSFKGKSWLVRETLGGWQVNDILNLQTGMPYNVSLGYNSAGLDQGTERPNWVHQPKDNCSLKNLVNGVNGFTANGKTVSCVDLSAYALPVPQQTQVTVGGVATTTAFNYAFGNTSRNTLHGPGFSYDNLSIFKNFQIWESAKFQFRAEASNVFNHPSAANPNSSNGSGNPTLNAASLTSTAISPTGNAGSIIDVQKIPGELSGARALQLAAKIIF
jgi:hypothetical protein